MMLIDTIPSSITASAYAIYCNAFAVAVTGGIANDTTHTPANAEAKALGAAHGNFVGVSNDGTKPLTRPAFERLIAKRHEVDVERNDRLTAFTERLTMALDKSEAPEIVCFLEAEETRLLIADITAIVQPD